MESQHDPPFVEPPQYRENINVLLENTTSGCRRLLIKRRDCPVEEGKGEGEGGDKTVIMVITMLQKKKK